MAKRTSSQRPPSRRPGARPEKRAAIVAAARRSFGEEGFARSSIDRIAEGAGVSTRTIYNHFASKDDLFAAVLEESATEVADDFVARIQAEEGDEPLEPRLRELAALLVGQVNAHPEHFAMVRQITAEARHFPPGTLEAWQEAGPLRVEREVADYLHGLAESGDLRASDPTLTARHFIALTTAEVTARTHLGGAVLDKTEVRRLIETGVNAFLHGYAS